MKHLFNFLKQRTSSIEVALTEFNALKLQFWKMFKNQSKDELEIRKIFEDKLNFLENEINRIKSKIE